MDEQEKKKRKEKAYQDYVKTKTPVHNVYLNMAKAFVTGGTICVIGQFFMNFCKNAGCTEEISGTWTSLMLVLLSVLLTGWNLYPGIAKWEAQGRSYRSPDLPIPWRLRQSNIKKKDRYLESDVKYLRLQARLFYMGL